VLDGTQAQIDFTAAHPAARQALEAGLPALAAALQGEGLTLAGGGVFDQRPGRGGDPDGSRQGSQDRGGDTRGRLDGADAASPRAGRATAARGLVDLVA
jgi:flagellar hook-length control protein FliK